MLLYERFLGRPFAGHRDSVSELVGDVVETAVEGLLSRTGISNRKTKRAERVTDAQKRSAPLLKQAAFRSGGLCCVCRRPPDAVACPPKGNAAKAAGGVGTR